MKLKRLLLILNKTDHETLRIEKEKQEKTWEQFLVKDRIEQIKKEKEQAKEE